MKILCPVMIHLKIISSDQVVISSITSCQSPGEAFITGVKKDQIDPPLCLGFEHIHVCNVSQAHWELVVESAAPVIEASPGDWQLVIDGIATCLAEIMLRWTIPWHKIFITVYWLLSQHCLVNRGKSVQGCALVHWELSTDITENRDWSVTTKSSKRTENFVYENL